MMSERVWDWAWDLRVAAVFPLKMCLRGYNNMASSCLRSLRTLQLRLPDLGFLHYSFGFLTLAS